MRVLVCGDREWDDKEYIFDCLDMAHSLYDFSLVIEGEAKGADITAREWAQARGIPFKGFPAQWHRYRHAAGPIRNKQMLDEGKPELVIAFHDDLEHSKGTKNMVTLAEKAEIDILVFSHVED